MKKQKFLFMLLAMLMMAVGTKAAEAQYVVFDLKDAQVVIALQDRPVINCQNGELKVTVGGETKVTAPLGDVVKYSFTDTPSGIGNVNDEQTHMELGHVYVAHAPKGATVRVFTIDGKQVTAQRIGDDGSADIDLSPLGKGLFIVKTPHSSIKIINK